MLARLAATIREQYPTWLVLADDKTDDYNGVPTWMAKKNPGNRGKPDRPDIILGEPGPGFNIASPTDSADKYDLTVHFIDFLSPGEQGLGEAVDFKRRKLERQATATKARGWNGEKPEVHVIAVGMRGSIPESTITTLEELNIPKRKARQCWTDMQTIAIQRFTITHGAWMKQFNELPAAIKYPTGWTPTTRQRGAPYAGHRPERGQQSTNGSVRHMPPRPIPPQPPPPHPPPHPPPPSH
jgi:hypothetical protein